MLYHIVPAKILLLNHELDSCITRVTWNDQLYEGEQTEEIGTYLLQFLLEYAE